jgi:hypothetical protein
VHYVGGPHGGDRQERGADDAAWMFDTGLFAVDLNVAKHASFYFQADEGDILGKQIHLYQFPSRRSCLLNICTPESTCRKVPVRSE